MPVIDAEQSGTAASAEIYVETNAYGFVTRAELRTSTTPAFGQACVEAIRQWRYSPARENGFPVPAKFIQPIRYADGVIDTMARRAPETRPAGAIHRVAPNLPDDLLGITGSTVIAVRLDATGNIDSLESESSTHPELEAPCKSAVLAWRFKPSLVAGHPVPSTVHVPFVFKGRLDPSSPEPKPATPTERAPHPLRNPSPILPAGIAEANGEAEVAFIIDDHGFVLQPQILSATQPEFGIVARTAVLNWKYRPAVRNGLPTAVKVIQPFRFNRGMVVTTAQTEIDRLPTPRRTEQPAIPEALRGIPGYVNVLFSIDRDGNVTEVEAVEASLVELKNPTLAAAKNWRFKPATKSGEPIPSKATIAFQFGK